VLECLVALFGLANGGTTFLGGFLMKKFFLLFAASAMLFSFVSCSNGDDDDSTSNDTTAVVDNSSSTDNSSSSSSGSSSSGSSTVTANPFTGHKYVCLENGQDPEYKYFDFTSDKIVSSSKTDYKYEFDATTITIKSKANGQQLYTLEYSFNSDKSVLTIKGSGNYSTISGKYTSTAVLPNNSSNNPFVGNVYRSTDTTNPMAYYQNFLEFTTDYLVNYSHTNYVYKIVSNEDLYLYKIDNVNSRVYALTYSFYEDEGKTMLEIHGDKTGYYEKANE